MKRVVHLGPIHSNGGMSSVMKLLIEYSPDGWIASSINTHSDGEITAKIISWNNSKKELKEIINKNEIDIAHIHVTHSMSWWRKISLKKICKKNNIPTIIHIHSGRFDEFCNRMYGMIGKNVRKNLKEKNTTVIVLEDRWKTKLKYWIPSNIHVVNNPAIGSPIIRKINDNEKIKILMLSRKSTGKGHLFAISVLDALIVRGIDAELSITGVTKSEFENLRNGRLKPMGWVSDIKKQELLDKSSILIMPSAFEGSSMSVIEAIVNNLPCLVSPASNETLGVNELVLELDNPDEWADKIIEICHKEKYDEIVNQIKKYKNKYSIGQISNKWKDIYEEILSSD